MIKLLITLVLIIALLVISWQFFVKNQTEPKQEPESKKKVQFSDNVESFTIAEKNNVSSNLEKLYKQVNPSNFYT